VGDKIRGMWLVIYCFHRQGETMKKQSHKPGEKNNKVLSSNPSTKAKADHPLLQLQQTIDNKAVTNMIQRHSDGIKKQFSFWVMSTGGEKYWLDESGSAKPDAETGKT
jgi:hypothetical protein